MKQRTIQKEVTFFGVGLHTGKETNVKLIPAADNHGIVFKRTDLENQPLIPAEVSVVTSTNRSTTLTKGEGSIQTVEHLLSALYGSRVDNVLIEVDGPEIPILDGCAETYFGELSSAGFQEQSQDRQPFEIKETITFVDEETGAEFTAMPAEDFEVLALLEFDSDLLNHQFASIDSLDEYGSDIAPARTFVFLHDLEYLLDQNLIKGGDIDNAIVLVDKVLDKDEAGRLAAKLNKPAVEVCDRGVLEGVQLKYDNEPARHKVLDLIGDLSLLGRHIKGRIVARKPGHTPNIEFVKVLKRHLRDQIKLKGKPDYDPTIPPIIDTTGIMKLLPHRPPFLLIDKVIELSDTQVVCIKNVTMNEDFFKGHFPDNPVFPGVLQVEAMAQTGGILALSTVEEPHKWDTYFVKIQNARFRDKVVPGDTLIFKLELLQPIRRGLVHMQGTAYVGNKIVSEADMTAQIVKAR